MEKPETAPKEMNEVQVEMLRVLAGGLAGMFVGQYHEILENEPGLGNVYLGTDNFSKDTKKLQELGIKLVVSAMVSTVATKQDEKTTGIKQHLEHINDNGKESLLSRFDALYEIISEGRKNGNVFIHCAGGRSRSATIAIAYVMKQYNKTYPEAYALVKSKRTFVLPNPQFVQDLKDYQAMLEAANSSK